MTEFNRKADRVSSPSPSSRDTRVSRRVATIALVSALPSCSTLMPAHDRSNSRAGERTQVRFLDAKEMKELTGNEPKVATFEEVFDDKGLLEAKAIPGLLATGLGFAASAAINFVQNALTTEAALYEAEHSANSSGDGFWTVDVETVPRDDNKLGFKRTTRQQYAGLLYERYSVASAGREPTLALRLIASITPTEPRSKGTAFEIRPEKLLIERTKAKVLSNQISDWWSYLWIWAFNADHFVNVDASLQFTVVQRNEDGSTTSEALNAIPFRLHGFDLDGEHEWTAGSDHFRGVSGLMPPIPFRLAAPSGAASVVKNLNVSPMSITVVVVESDPSNVKQYVERLSSLVEDKKDSILSKLK